MSATVHHLHNSAPVAAFIRVGHHDHKWLEERLAAGRLPFRRFVFDAAHFDAQLSLVAALKKSGAEILLDTNFAELCSPGKFRGSASKLPWANSDRPWEEDDFGGNRAKFLMSQVAEFAVARKVHTILSPSRVIDAKGSGLASNARLSGTLRNALDLSGGQDISLDYQVISTAALLRDDEFRAQVVDIVRGVEATNTWLRISGFDAHSTGAGTKRHIESLSDLHLAGKPIVGDMIGGLPGLAAAAAGAVGGICHGAGGKESFRISDYRKEPSGGGGGGKRRVYIADLGRWIGEDQFEAIVQTKGAKSKLFCRSRDCCPQGRDDMIDDGKGHFLHQRNEQIRDLSRIPDSRRLDHFIVHHLGTAVSFARSLSRLNFDDQRIRDAMNEEKKRLSRMTDALRNISYSDGEIRRSDSPAFRGGGNNLVLLAGRS